MKQKMLLGAAFLAANIGIAQAQPVFEGNYPLNQPLEEYFAAQDENYNKSIIYIFYNNDTDCYQCPQTIELTEQIFNQYYNGTYSLFVINYEEDEEYDFASAYGLTEPLAIVLVKISNGQNLGYVKLPNPQNMLSTGQDFTNYLTEQINSYLGN